MTITEKQLLDLKTQIEESKTKVAQLEGQKQALLKQLEDYDCHTIEEAEKRLEQLNKEVVALQKQIDKGCEKIGETYKFK